MDKQEFSTGTQALRSCPVEVRFDSLFRNTPYTLTASPIEEEKLRGQEPLWAKQEAERRGTVVVWMTNEAWERARACPALCVACSNEVGPGPWHNEGCEDYAAGEKVAA